MNRALLSLTLGILVLAPVPNIAAADRDPSAVDVNAPAYVPAVVPAYLPAPAALPSSAWIALPEAIAPVAKTVAPRPYEVVGSVRDLPRRVRIAGPRQLVPLDVAPLEAPVAGGSTAISLGVSGTHAHGLRLHLELTDVPPGTRGWVQADDNAVGPFDLPQSGEFWTPLVFGSRAVLHVVAGAAGSGTIEIDKVAELTTDLRQPAPNLGTCMPDITCSTPTTELVDIKKASTATAMLVFPTGNDLGLCTGGLINVAATAAFEPYILTAHHCISGQITAAATEFFFDFHVPACGGSKPEVTKLPRVSGASLLVTGEYADYSLLQMASAAPSGANGRWYLGWDSGYYAETAALRLYRISHPHGEPQKYSRHSVNATTVTCSDAYRGGYIYSTSQVGGVESGSSGSPTFIVTNGAYYIVGQLFGQCGARPEDGCDRTNQVVDGAFNVSYEAMKPWLRPSATSCTANSTTLCLQNNRFEVKLFARDPRSGKTDNSQVMTSTNFFGYFAFPVLTGNTTDPQVFIKILDGTPVNGKWWVFYASLTDVEFTLTVRDTKSGLSKQYRQEPYTQKSANDTGAF